MLLYGNDNGNDIDNDNDNDNDNNINTLLKTIVIIIHVYIIIIIIITLVVKPLYACTLIRLIVLIGNYKSDVTSIRRGIVLLLMCFRVYLGGGRQTFGGSKNI